MQRIYNPQEVKEVQPTPDPNPERWSTEDALLIPTGICELRDRLLSADFNTFSEFFLGKGFLFLEAQARYKRPTQSLGSPENLV